jgi:hypothetical protein
MGYCMQIAQFHKQDEVAKEIQSKMTTLGIGQ